ncbi:MAG: transcriptional regulator [Candidatus Microsaccharimonas sossegonensis]|uniref:Transcriptional regulator n=1 Tax=Candidatus Microsaccharimonas sossegonensis TaxID=2506948 RepID=A0A4Q0AFY6_9BACT|nr:MAG: transcriptional regulator [Candidatus Microsaccharimonas sossegonensis]
MHSNTQQLKQELQNNEAIELCAKQCGVIGDTIKLKICYLLRHYPELNVTTIAKLADTSISNVSHSLRKLKEAGLVDARRQSQAMYYSLKKDAFRSILQVIGG